MKLVGIVAAIAALVIITATAVTIRPLATGDVFVERAYLRGNVTNLGVREDSRVRALHVDVGQTVKKDDRLVEFDNEFLEARVNERRAAVEQVQAAIELVKQETSIANKRDRLRYESAAARLEARQAEREGAVATLELARREYQRARELAQEGAFGQSQLDDARESFETANADVRELSAEILDLEARVTIAEVELDNTAVRQARLDRLKSELAVAEAALQSAGAALTDAVINAPAAGLIVEISAREGASVRPNDPVLTMWLHDQVWVEAWLRETDAIRVTEGMKATVTLEDRELDGRVAAVLVAPDGRQQTLPGRPASPLLPERSRFVARIDLSGDTSELLPGLTADVTIETEQAP